MAQQIQVDPVATVTYGSTAVAFSRTVGVSTAIDLEAGSEVVMPSDPSNVYAIASVSDDGRSAVLATPFAGPSGPTPVWFANTNVPGMTILGSAPLTTGATSINLKAAVSVETEGPFEIMFASQPYRFSMVLAVLYVTTGPLSTTAGETTVVSFSPPYTGPTTVGSVNVGLVGITG